MADKLTPERRSANMAKIKSKGMKPEMAVRKAVHALGFRYRLHRKDLPGKPDLVFAGRRKVIFVHGCFWHQHSLDSCLDGRQPKSNTGYWQPKLARNIERDADAQQALRADGWDVLTLWECQIRDDETLKRTLLTFIGRNKEPRRSRQ